MLFTCQGHCIEKGINRELSNKAGGFVKSYYIGMQLKGNKLKNNLQLGTCTMLGVVGGGGPVRSKTHLDTIGVHIYITLTSLGCASVHSANCCSCWVGEHDRGVRG